MTQSITQERVFQQLSQAGQPLSFRALSDTLGVSEKADKRRLTSVLDELSAAGRVLVNRNGDYGLVDQMDLLRGVVIGHPDGYGFLKTDKPGSDWFLPPRQMDLVFPGDRVLARPAGTDRRGRDKASIVEVLARKTEEVAGRFHLESGVSWVVPENPQNAHQLLVPPEHRGGAVNGDMVRARILRYPERNVQPMAVILQVLGAATDVATRIDIAITEYGLPQEFPDAVKAELVDLPRPALAADCHDSRDMPFVTIDGADAKDFDDALCARRTPQGWRLWVAIADVSRYVVPGTALDDEARERATSIYFPGRVIPMLPPVLSDDLCSLRPDEDRHAMVCEMVIGRDGQMRSSRFYAALIRSRARLIYEDVAKVLEGEGGQHPQAAGLKILDEVFVALHAAREARGALDFEGREVSIEFAEDGSLAAVHPVTRTRAHRLVEECMVAANVAAARFLRRHKLVALNRVHPPPPADTLADFRQFLAEWGLTLGGRQKPGPEHYQAVLSEVAGQPQATLVQGALLRALSQATYAPDLIGHFGLALEDYAHFTSPIRRYPDLVVHRAIKWALSSHVNEDWPWSFDAMTTLGGHCSDRERRADQASLGVVQALKIEFLSRRIGEVFEGEVVGVTNFGLFVEIDEVRVSGLVHISALGRDYFHHEPALHRLRGERSGQMFRLGDRMRVRLIRADAQDRKIDFEPLAHQPVVLSSGPGGGKRGKRDKIQDQTQWREL